MFKYFKSLIDILIFECYIVLGSRTREVSTPLSRVDSTGRQCRKVPVGRATNGVPTKIVNSAKSGNSRRAEKFQFITNNFPQECAWKPNVLSKLVLESIDSVMGQAERSNPTPRTINYTTQLKQLNHQIRLNLINFPFADQLDELSHNGWPLKRALYSRLSRSFQFVSRAAQVSRVHSYNLQWTLP